MRRSMTLALAAAICCGIMSAAAPVDAKVPTAVNAAPTALPDWVHPATAHAAGLKLAPQVAKRPAVLLEPSATMRVAAARGGGRTG